MPHSFLIPMATLALVLSVLCPTTTAQELPTASPEALGLAADDLARIRPAMQQYVDDGYLAGLVTLVARRGQIVHLEAVGYQDLEAGTPMPTNALFRIASMTKPITSTAVLMLYDEGRFDLDDPIAIYLPALGSLEVYAGTTPEGEMRTVPPERPVTIRDLLTHTSGIASEMFGNSPVNARYREVNPIGSSEFITEAAEKIATIPLQHQPGAAWTYGLSTDVLAALVETVSGQLMQQFLQERLFGPLHMTDTDYVVSADRLDRFTTLYAHGDGGVLERVVGPAESYQAQPTTRFRGTGGLVSTVFDYARFAQMLLNNGALDGAQILRPETARLMRTNQLAEALLPMRVGSNNDMPGPGQGFGLGLGVVLDENAVAVPYSEGTVWWIGSTDTYFWIDPEEELVGILMTQLGDLELHPFYPEFVWLVYASLLDSGASEDAATTVRRTRY